VLFTRRTLKNPIHSFIRLTEVEFEDWDWGKRRRLPRLEVPGYGDRITLGKFRTVSSIMRKFVYCQLLLSKNSLLIAGIPLMRRNARPYLLTALLIVVVYIPAVGATSNSQFCPKNKNNWSNLYDLRCHRSRTTNRTQFL
jgi:hypothetical protein